LGHRLKAAQDWIEQKGETMPKCNANDSVILDRNSKLLGQLKKKMNSNFPLGQIVMEALQSKHYSPFSGLGDKGRSADASEDEKKSGGFLGGIFGGKQKK
jgi:hypothetical protein